MTTLRSITEDYNAIMSQIEANEGEITPELNDQLEITEANKVQKIGGYVEFIHSQEAFNARIDDEVKRLQAMKKTTVYRVDYLKARLLDAVKLFGIIELPFNKVTIRQSKAVLITDEDALPQAFTKTVTKTTADKTAIKKAIESGETVEGAELLIRDNLAIK